ncbi:serine/threonine-protein kinase [Sandaracinus amylolyticus]|uniref:serine/threonine-protein kinase n=1 Tax=Sandaracinus amylolyticus TaxID=927083 RepID=UPI001F0066A7|nr:serine/threonine-protein kinase [Sandaracinus amylolyticus]UJR79916.1 Serine/Threonine protein kinase [Sandaracinus amylolyticus]
MTSSGARSSHPATRDAVPSEEIIEISLASSSIVEVPPEAARVPVPGGVPERIGRYRLLHELGRGAMARVHVAVTHGPAGFEHLAAIKTLLDCYTHLDEFNTMLLDEARLGAAIRHPNVVETVSVGIDPIAGPFLVMQYVEGVTLATLIKRAREQGRAMPTRVIVRILADMLEGLAAAHAVRGPDGEPMRIVHRDVSPQNVLVGVDGIAKVSDFGVAKAKARLTTTQAGQFKGKASYSSPEHIAGEQVDERADVFSAGVMLWEGLTGQRLFKGDMVTSMRRVLTEPIPWISRIAPQHEAFDEIAARALERTRERRFQSADAMLEALMRVAEETGVVGTHREVSAFVALTCGDGIDSDRRVIAHQRTIARDAPKRDASSDALDITIPTPPPASMAQDAQEARKRRASARLDTIKVRIAQRKQRSAARWMGLAAVTLAALTLAFVVARVARPHIVATPIAETALPLETEAVAEPAPETPAEVETAIAPVIVTLPPAAAEPEVEAPPPVQVRREPRRARPVAPPPPAEDEAPAAPLPETEVAPELSTSASAVVLAARAEASEEVEETRSESETVARDEPDLAHQPIAAVQPAPP